MQSNLTIAKEKLARAAQGEIRGRAAAGKALVAFIVLMIALTLANNTLQELSVAVVTPVTPQRGALERSINVDGTLASAKNVPVFSTESARVSEVYVKAGASVAEGDPLFKLDMTALNDLLATEQTALDKLLNNLEKSQLAVSNDPTDTAVKDAERSLARAKQNRSTNIETQDIAVARAQKDLADAQDALVTANSDYQTALDDAWADYVKQKQTAVESAQTALRTKQSAYDNAYDAYYNPSSSGTGGTGGSGGSDTSSASAQRKLSDALYTAEQELMKANTALMTAQQEIMDALNRMPDAVKAVDALVLQKKNAITSAETNVTSRQTALENAERSRENAVRDANRSVEDAQISLDKAMLSYETSVKSSEASKAQSEIDLKNSQMDIDTRKANVARIQKAIDSEGVVHAPVNGDVISVSVSVGGNASSTSPAVTLSNENEGLELRVTVTEDQVGDMTVGDSATIVCNGASINAPISSIAYSATATGRYDVTFLLDGSAGTVGMTASMRFRKRTSNYDVIIPLTALHEDNDGTFVYVITQDSGSLGAKRTVTRADVSVIDQDSTRAAVQGGVSQRDQVVSRSDRDLADGDRVRYEGD